MGSILIQSCCHFCTLLQKLKRYKSQRNILWYGFSSRYFSSHSTKSQNYFCKCLLLVWECIRWNNKFSSYFSGFSFLMFLFFGKIFCRLRIIWRTKTLTLSEMVKVFFFMQHDDITSGYFSVIFLLHFLVFVLLRKIANKLLLVFVHWFLWLWLYISFSILRLPHIRQHNPHNLTFNAFAGNFENTVWSSTN